MKKSVCHFSSYFIPDDKIPIPELLKDKDKRADLPARIAVLSADHMLSKMTDIDLCALNIITVNREGCAAHIEKVSTSIKNHQPAQGFFVRGGPQTLATYTALALGSHGAAFTFVGDQRVLTEAISMAIYLTKAMRNSSTLLIFIVKGDVMGYQANTALIHNIGDIPEISSPSLEREIYAHLSLALNIGRIK
jgi:hypothetical protein